MMKRVIITVVLTMWAATCVGAQDRRAVDAVTNAMVAIGAGDWAKASDVAKPAGQVGQDIVDWYRLRAGAGSFAEYREFLDRRSDWPGLPLMRRSGERSIPRNASAKHVIEYFADLPPATGTGALRLIAAYVTVGDNTRAEALVVHAWTSLSLAKSEQAKFLKLFTPLLKDHHVARLDMLLWRGRTTEAARMDSLISKGQRALARARTGLMKKVKGVNGLIKAVPKALISNPGLAHARFIWRAKKGLGDGAIELLLAHSTSADTLGRPEEWSNRRRQYARQMMRNGDAKLAYQLASQHFLEPGDKDYADLEWLSGFIALSDLDDPESALQHFQRFRKVVDTPISLGRAGYWQGRTYDALNQGPEARLAYEFGGGYQTSFYGQLAAEKAGLDMDPGLTGQEEYADFRDSDHWDSTVMQAAMLFYKGNRPLLFTRFTRHLAEILTSEERGSLAQLALDLDQPYAALYMAKYAAEDGVVLMRPYFPVTDITDRDLPVSKELTLAIARRESEFYPRVQKPGGGAGIDATDAKNRQGHGKEPGPEVQCKTSGG